MLSRTKIFYGWFVVAGAFLIAMAIMGMHFNLIGLYFPHFVKEFGFSNSRLGMYFITSVTLISTATSYFIAKIYSKIPLRIGMSLAGFMAGFVYIGYSFATNAYQFIILSMIFGLCLGLGTVSAFSMLSTRWFIKKRGTAISIIASGTGLAGVFFSGYLSNIIETKGFQQALFTEGLMIMGLALIGALLIRSNPESMGLTALGAGEELESKQQQQTSSTLRSLDLKEAMKHYPFYVLVTTLVLMNGMVVTFVSQYVSYFRTLNFEATTIAFIVTGLGVSLTLSKVVFGIIIDKFGMKVANYCLFSAWIIALATLIFANSSPLLVIVFVIFSGSLPVITSVSLPLWVAHMFGDKHFPQLIGRTNSIGGIGSMTGPIVVGYFIDISNYKTVFSTALIIMLALAILMTFALNSAEKKRHI